MENLIDSPPRRNSSDADLHDHRLQPQSLPRHGTIRSTTPTASSGIGRSASCHSKEPEFRQFDEEVKRHQRRDSEASDRLVAGHLVIENSSEDPCLISPIPIDLQHRPSFIQTKRPRGETNASRRAPVFLPEALSRTPSPPNSVDAFATAKRKGRSGTFSSQVVGSDVASLKRTASRRLSNEELGEPQSGDEAPGQVEEDVCFPMPEEPARWKIDFDEMEEFVTEQDEDRSRSVGCYERRRKMSTCSSIRGRYFPQLRPVVPDVTIVESPSLKERDECAVVDDDDVKTDLARAEKRDSEPLEKQQHVRRVSPPDRFSIFSSELDSTVHAPYFGDLLIEGETFRELFRTDHNNVWWLDVVNPTEAEMKMLTRAFSLHPLTAEDIRMQETREKVELFRSYYFVCFRSFIQDKKSENYMEPVNLYLVVFREGVLSFQFNPSPHSSNVRRRIRKLRDYMSLSSDWICYALIDDITDAFGPAINEVERDAEAIEDAVFTARNEDIGLMLKRIGDGRKKIMCLMRLLGGKADVIKGFAKRCNENYEVTPRGEIGLYLGDIQDHVITMMGNLTHFEKMLSRSHSNYLAQLSVDHMESSNRANEVLSKITIIATILVPMNLVTGLFGMNVPVPGRETTGLQWFFGIVGVIVGFATIGILVAKRMRFI